MFEKDFYYEVEKPDKLKYILYGDSVSEKTKTIVEWQESGIREYISFDELWNKLVNIGLLSTYINEKEYIFIKNEIKTLTYEVKEDKLKMEFPDYIMRHRKKEKLIRLKINGDNYLDVTNHHSLIDYDFNKNTFKKIYPSDCRYLPILDNQTEFEYSFNIYYFLLGLFYGDGSFSGKNEYYPRFTSSKRDELIKFIKSYSPNIIIYYKRSSSYDFLINDNNLDLLLEKSNIKRVKSPQRKLNNGLFDLLNQNENHLLNFLCGYYLADGSYTSNVLTLTSSSYILLKKLSHILMNLGIFSCVQTDAGGRKYNNKIKGDMYKLKILTTNSKIIEIINKIVQFKNTKEAKKTGTFYGLGTSPKNKGVTRKIQNARIRNIRPLNVKSKEEINYDGYVYDISVPKTQLFIANGFVVHNTDSIFIAIPESNVKEKSAEERWEIAENSAKKINELIIDYTKETLLKRCNIDPKYNRTFFDTELLMENIMFLDIKKNYAYNLLVKEGKVLNPPKTNYKGIQVIKSDAAKMTRNLLRDMIENVILNSKIENSQKITNILSIIEKFHNKFAEDIKESKFDDIGVPAKWSKDELNINGMKIYNHLMGEEVFSFGSAGKFIYTKFQSMSEFKNLGINVKNINGICVPYTYNQEKLKEKMNQFGISVDAHRQWNDKIFTKTCQRVVDLARKVSKENSK